jgi:hypothetical protein
VNPPTITDTEDLRAYHGDEKLKEETVAKARMHKEAGEFVTDEYFSKNGKTKVCAVGCITEDPNGGHHLYPTRWGIPEWLAYLEEKIFTGLPDEKMAAWPERFLEAIPVGADFDGLADRLAIRRLKEECLPLSGEWPESVRGQVVAAIEQTIAALESGKSDDRSAAESAARSAEWSAARSAEWSAAWSAESAESAAWSAESAAWSAAWSAESAARSAEWAAESAARSAAWSAESAARSAEWAAARSAEWSAAFDREADRLIAELEALPVTGVAAA